MNNRNNENDIQRAATTAATAAVAAASSTPFKTAFKITIGIGLAQLTLLALSLLIFGGVVGSVGVVLYSLFK